MKMKAAILPIPCAWLSLTALQQLAAVLVLRNAGRVWAHMRRPLTQEEQDAKWWMETKRQINRGYRAFCERRGLDPDAPEWKN